MLIGKCFTTATQYPIKKAWARRSNRGEATRYRRRGAKPTQLEYITESRYCTWGLISLFFQRVLKRYINRYETPPLLTNYIVMEIGVTL